MLSICHWSCRCLTCIAWSKWWVFSSIWRQSSCNGVRESISSCGLIPQFNWFNEMKEVSPFCSLLKAFSRCEHSSCRYTCAQLFVLGEVQECEIRWRFVEGDNEQSAILPRRAPGCEVRNCYTLSDLNYSMLGFFLTRSCDPLLLNDNCEWSVCFVLGVKSHHSVLYRSQKRMS